MLGPRADVSDRVALDDEEVITFLLRVYVSGFASGIASVAMSGFGVSQQDSAAYGRAFTESMVADRLAVEQLRDNIKKIAHGGGAPDSILNAGAVGD